MALAAAGRVADDARGRPVQLAARKADRELARDRNDVFGQHAGAFRLRQGQRRGSRQHRVPARRRDPGGARDALCLRRGHRLGGRGAEVRRRRRHDHRRVVQTVPMGVADARRVRAPLARNTTQGGRAAVEDTAVDQRIATDPLGTESEPPESAPGRVRAISDFRRLRSEASVLARGRQRHRLSRRRGAARGWNLRRRRLGLSGLYAAPALRRQLRRHRLVGRRR